MCQLLGSYTRVVHLNKPKSLRLMLDQQRSNKVNNVVVMLAISKHHLLEYLQFEPI